MKFSEAFGQLPLIAILRGVTPEKALSTGKLLIEAGFTLIEVPLNSPDAPISIRLLTREFGMVALFGGGTVLSPADVDRVAEAGGRYVVSPNCDPAVIQRTKQRELTSLPGVATPSEAFTALQNGADGLKLFPAELLPPQGLTAFRAVLPPDVLLLPVGGIDESNMRDYLLAGAAGFGLGGSLYGPNLSDTEISARAASLVQAYRAL